VPAIAADDAAALRAVLARPDRSTGLAGRGLLRSLPPVRRLLFDRLRRRFR
jgi:hypothetical protein